MARVCVLFEDLRIELIALTMPDQGSRENMSEARQLDIAGYQLRRIYFLRRSIATSWEFAESVRLLDETKGFEKVLGGLSEPEQSMWRDAVGYFSDREEFWKKIRNDVGGHFGEDAARFAVPSLSANSSGPIEWHCDSQGRGGFILGFSAEIAATALLRHLPGSTITERAQYLNDEIVKAFGHAIIAAEVISSYFWDRAASNAI